MRNKRARLDHFVASVERSAQELVEVPIKAEPPGEYVLLNQNLITHRVRARFEPTDALTVNLLTNAINSGPISAGHRSEARGTSATR